uniref:CSON013121 protein n=1 Tax=Culicoides sonorensis TaxID=179676 RepID=A0A336KLP7_CULSO
MVYRFTNSRSDFIFSGSLPDETITYSRKGGCFVTICRGISIAVLLLIFIFFLTFTIFFATKYAYDIKPNITLEDFLNHRPYIIDKRVRTPKHIIPKHYCLYIAPIFNETTKPFSYNGIVWITILSKRHNTKRIEVNIKELDIKPSDVSVYRSLKLTSLDFDDDPEWDSKEIQKNSVTRRSKRETEEVGEMGDGDGENETTVPVTTENVVVADNQNTPPNNAEEQNEEPQVEIIDVQSEADEEETINNAAEIIPDEDTIISSSTSEPESASTSTKRPRTNRYHHINLEKDEFIPIKVTDVEHDEANERLFIYLGTEMKKDIYYIVRINFSGNMTHDRGLYFTTYEDTANEISYFTATFLEPDARLLFPCLEDHNIQTPYDISIARRTSMVTDSISDLEEPETLNATWFVDEYNRTNSVRASEIGFIVTNMQPRSFEITPNLTFIFYAREKYTQDLNYTVDLLKDVIQIYETYFESQFPFEKVKYVCVPNGPPSQREVKDSMILSSEHHILYSHYFPSFPKIYVDQTVAYEVALEWLHKTYEWQYTEQYWVYEALPIFIQNVALDQLQHRSEKGNSDQLIIGDRFKALRDEVHFKTTAINMFDWDWDDTNNYHFIQRKGYSILRMFNHTLGETAFQSAVKKFVSERLNKEISLFNECLTQASKNSSKIPKHISISEYITSWQAMEKYPIINITIDRETGDIKVDHVQFSFGGEAPHQSVSIPIYYTNDTVKNFDFMGLEWIEAPYNSTVIRNVLDAGTNDSWVIVNPMGIGYYRVNYNTETWKQFANILKESPEDFPHYTRALLIDDVLNLARFGFVNYSIAFDLVSYLNVNEKEYFPWKEAYENLKFLYNILKDRPGFEIIEKFMVDTIKPVYEEVIIKDSAEGSSQGEEKLRIKSLIYEWACLVGHPPCIEHQKREFYKLIEQNIIIDSQKSLDEDELYLMVCTTIQYSGNHEWNTLAKSIPKTIDLNEKKTLLRGMGCTREIHLVRKYLKYLTDDEMYKLAGEIILAVSQNKVALKYTLDYMYENWNSIRQYHDLKDLSIMFNNIVNRNEFEIFRGIFAKYFDKFTTRDKELLRTTRAMILKSLDWKEQISRLIQH